MKTLTKAEEQVMQHLWKLNEAFLKDIVDAYPNPKPAYTTISTVIRVLVKKKFIGFEKFGKTNRYFPLVSKQAYTKATLSSIMTNFFSGSVSSMASFFTKNNSTSIEDLEAIKDEIEQQIKALKS